MTGKPILKRTLRLWREDHVVGKNVRWPVVLHSPKFRPHRTLRARRRLEKLIEGREAVAPGALDLEALYFRVRRALGASDPLVALARRDRWRAPWVFFYLPRDAPPRTMRLGARIAFVRRYTQWMRDRRRPRPILALLHEFLREYPTELRTFEVIRTTLVDLVDSGTRPSMRRAREQCREFHLLERDGDIRFARRVVVGAGAGGDQSVQEMLVSAGLDTGLAHAGFLRSGLQGLLEVLAGSRPAATHFVPSRIARLIELLESEGRLRFDGLRSRIAAGFLRPFVREQPPRRARKPIERFLLRHYGHPHMPSGRVKWNRISEDLRGVFLRWLAERALEAFFSVMRDTALEHHWRYRDRFWRAYFDAGLVAEAWFALGAKAARKLERLPDEEAGARGSLHGAGSDQSVLLMRLRGMPGFTVAEWSHSGACRTWLDGNASAPRLYREQYSRHDARRGHGLMRGSDFHVSHYGSENGRWQDRLAEWMEDHTGVSVPRSRYLV